MLTPMTRARIVIFGTGGWYQNNKTWLHHYYEVVAFADNNVQRQGMFIDGRPVLAPTELDAVLADSDPHSPEGLLCDILSVQAMVHAERAGHELAALSAAAQSPQPSTRTATTKTAQKARKIEYIDKNVIAFPH